MSRKLTIEEIASLDLPKWPQMLVWGQPVTEEQAKQVILRTDEFFYDLYGWSANSRWGKSAREVLGLERSDLTDQQKWSASTRLAEMLGHIETEYVSNTWADSAFIFGAHGWCHPNGLISFTDNVGKWPSADELIRDWAVLAHAFPFLDCTATFMSGEQCEDDTHPVFSIVVKHGCATAVTPIEPTLYRRPDARSFEDHSALLSLISGAFKTRGNGIPDKWLDDYKATLAPLIEAAIATCGTES